MSVFFASLCRISDLEATAALGHVTSGDADGGWTVEPRRREEWATGDYVMTRVEAHGGRGWAPVELASGRLVMPVEGDFLVGALGARSATLELVGHWRDVGEDGALDNLTAAGLLGRVTSASPFVERPLPLRYRGHLVRGDGKVTMGDFAPAPVAEPVTLGRPVVFIHGSSMSAGKTGSARLVIRLLLQRGLTVVGTKLAGAGRYRDILSMADAGATSVLDFVDAGLPSTVVPEEVFRPRLRALLREIRRRGPDVVVVEAGASPLEPYQGAVVAEELAPDIRLRILCASDPYAAVGVIRAFGQEPDAVAGVATNTEAGVRLVKKLTGLPALALREPAGRQALAAMLEERVAPSS